MFGDLKNNSKKYFKSIFGAKLFDLNKYTLSFIDDFDDMINENFFKSRGLRKTLKKMKLKNKYRMLYS